MQFTPTKAELDRMIQDVASECDTRMLRWKSFAEKFDQLTDGDLTALGYSAEQVAYIRSFTAALKNIELRYRNQAPLNADDPSYFVKQMTRMLTF